MVGCETHFFFMLPEKELEEKINIVVRKSGYEVIEYLVRGEKRTKVLEIFVDREEGVNIDDLAGMSREIDEMLEEGAYLDEFSRIVVSSPGIDRPFRYLWQLHKHIGRTLEGILKDGAAFEGKIAEIFDAPGEIVLETFQGGKKKGDPVPVTVKFSDIKEARIKISFTKK